MFLHHTISILRRRRPSSTAGDGDGRTVLTLDRSLRQKRPLAKTKSEQQNAKRNDERDIEQSDADQQTNREAGDRRSANFEE